MRRLLLTLRVNVLGFHGTGSASVDDRRLLEALEERREEE